MKPCQKRILDAIEKMDRVVVKPGRSSLAALASLHDTRHRPSEMSGTSPTMLIIDDPLCDDLERYCRSDGDVVSDVRRAIDDMMKPTPEPEPPVSMPGPRRNNPHRNRPDNHWSQNRNRRK